MAEHKDVATLDVENLSKSYAAPLGRGKKSGGPVKALDSVTFSLRPGLYGLLGPNGAGKSTLLNIITGGLLPDGGRVLWRDVPMGQQGRAFRAELGFMPQQQGLYPTFTGRRFLRYLCALKQIPGDKVAAEVERVAEAVNLQDELDKRLGAYSGGMKQRLLAASTLLGTPRLLILDEPTAGLDPKERVRLRKLMARQAGESIVIIATHVVSDVECVADQILLLRQGQLADMAPPAALAEKYAPGGTLEDVYLAVFGGDEL